jgi:hypothetical protein
MTEGIRSAKSTTKQPCRVGIAHHGMVSRSADGGRCPPYITRSAQSLRPSHASEVTAVLE